MIIDLTLLTPSELPRFTDERYRFASTADVLAFYQSFTRWDTCDLRLTMAPDRSYAVDVLEEGQ
jgi:hypothetical protein